MRLLIVVLLFSYSSLAQENPWKSNQKTESSSESLSGQNPWGSNVEKEETPTSTLSKQKFPYRSDAFRYGYNNHLSPKGVVVPSIAVALPGFGILALPFVPIITAIPFSVKEKEISNRYRKEKPEATDLEIDHVKQGVRMKRWRNSGIGTAIGVALQTIFLYIIIENF
ncbi:MAG: hypothetical protein L7R84_02790 [Balneolaceae bacterium]|nr:hypothetical protein [Balneolaceae bacterium]